MADREKVIKGLRCLSDAYDTKNCDKCGYDFASCVLDVSHDALQLLKEQEPRVLTLEEVIAHYSLPPVFVDDLSAQMDYLQDITPLYFDFLSNDAFNVHWRGYQNSQYYLDDWKAFYGKNWRCWSAKPTDEQRKAVKWDE